MWKSVSSRRIAATLAIEPPIWQSDYFDRYLRSSESYSDKWQYVEQNRCSGRPCRDHGSVAVPRNDTRSHVLMEQERPENGAGAPPRRNTRPVRPEGGPSPRHNQSRPRTWADRRDHDCHRLDDRVWDLHRVSGVIAIEWRAGLAVTRMGARRLADDHRRAVLFGVGDDDAASRRCLCFSARSVRFSDRIFVWLDVVPRGPNGDDRSGSDCVREVSRRFCHISFTR